MCARAALHIPMRSFTRLSSISWCWPFWSTRMCRCKIPCIAFILWAQTNLQCFLHLEKSTKRKWRARRRDFDLLLNKEVVGMWSQRHVWFTRHRWQDCNHSASCYSDDNVRLTLVSNSVLASPVQAFQALLTAKCARDVRAAHSTFTQSWIEASRFSLDRNSFPPQFSSQILPFQPVNSVTSTGSKSSRCFSYLSSSTFLCASTSQPRFSCCFTQECVVYSLETRNSAVFLSRLCSLACFSTKLKLPPHLVL